MKINMYERALDKIRSKTKYANELNEYVNELRINMLTGDIKCLNLRKTIKEINIKSNELEKQSRTITNIESIMSYIDKVNTIYIPLEFLIISIEEYNLAVKILSAVGVAFLFGKILDFLKKIIYECEDLKTSVNLLINNCHALTIEYYTSFSENTDEMR